MPVMLGVEAQLQFKRQVWHHAPQSSKSVRPNFLWLSPVSSTGLCTILTPGQDTQPGPLIFRNLKRKNKGDIRRVLEMSGRRSQKVNCLQYSLPPAVSSLVPELQRSVCQWSIWCRCWHRSSYQPLSHWQHSFCQQKLRVLVYRKYWRSANIRRVK